MNEYQRDDMWWCNRNWFCNNGSKVSFATNIRPIRVFQIHNTMEKSFPQLTHYGQPM